MAKAYAALQDDNRGLYAEWIAKASELRRVQLFAFNFYVAGRFQNTGKYDYVFDEDGHALLSEEVFDIEDHAMNMFFFYDEGGSVSGVEKADGFYHDEFPFGSGPIDANSFQNVDLYIYQEPGSWQQTIVGAKSYDGVWIHKDDSRVESSYTRKEFAFYAGDKEVKGPHGESVMTPVYLRPTPYAKGKRDQRNFDESGQRRARSLIVGKWNLPVFLNRLFYGDGERPITPQRILEVMGHPSLPVGV